MNMMKIRGVVLGTVEEQKAGGDEHPIDPTIIRLADSQEVPVSIGFQSDQRIGKTSRVWLEDGRLLFEADIDGSKLLRRKDKKYVCDTAAIGISFGTGRMFELGLTYQNENRNQPPWEVIE
jgi:hypothetical protein